MSYKSTVASLRTEAEPQVEKKPVEESKPKHKIHLITKNDVERFNKLFKDNKLINIFNFSKLFVPDTSSYQLAIHLPEKHLFKFYMTTEYHNGKLVLVMVLATMRREVREDAAYIVEELVWKDAMVVNGDLLTIDEFENTFKNHRDAWFEFKQPRTASIYLNLEDMEFYIDLMSDLDIKPVRRAYNKFDRRCNGMVTNLRGKAKISDGKYELVNLSIANWYPNQPIANI